MIASALYICDSLPARSTYRFHFFWPSTSLSCQKRQRPTRNVGSRTVPATPRYSLMDLFAGCGAMTRGFVDSGRFEPIFAVEFDPDAAATYAANFGADHIEVTPIEHVRSFPRTDVVI